MNHGPAPGFEDRFKTAMIHALLLEKDRLRSKYKLRVGIAAVLGISAFHLLLDKDDLGPMWFVIVVVSLLQATDLAYRTQRFIVNRKIEHLCTAVRHYVNKIVRQSPTHNECVVLELLCAHIHKQEEPQIRRCLAEARKSPRLTTTSGSIIFDWLEQLYAEKPET